MNIPLLNAFDADVLIYAAAPGHPLGEPVRELFRERDLAVGRSLVGVGSVLLLPELLSKPMRDDAQHEVDSLATLLGRLELLPVDHATATLATALGSRYRLRAADAVHLATAVSVGADRFITNNSSDFTAAISEIAIVTPSDLS